MVNSQNNNYDPVAAIFGFLILCLEMVQLALLAAFILSTWLTRLLFQWALLPLWPGLEKHDGLVVVMSGTLWAGVAGLGIFPALLHTELLQIAPESLVQNWLVSLGVGMVWGALVAVWVLVVWWEEIIAHQPPPPAFTGVLDLSPDFYQPTQIEAQSEIETLEALEAEFLRTTQTESTRHPLMLT